jgi:hypothetical protein
VDNRVELGGHGAVLFFLDVDNPNVLFEVGDCQSVSHLFFGLLSPAMKDLRPVVVRGPVTSGVARVVVDETRVAVVTNKETRGWFHDGNGLVQNGDSLNKFAVTIPDEEEQLLVVKAGGCTCGKPWLKKLTGAQLLDEHVGVLT